MDRQTAVETLKAGVKSLAESERFQAFLEMKARFHQYSMRNCALILMQNPKATHVAGFHKWRELSRWVKKGEKGIGILAPLMFAKKDKETGEKTGDVLRGFRVVHVFDVAQTDGKELPEPTMPEKLEGEQGADILECLRDFADHGDLTVLPSFDGFDSEANGDYSRTDKQIRIRAGLSTLQQAKTMAHECAHWVLHTSIEGAALDRGVKETEAEAVAFLTLAHFGIRADSYSFAYVAHWGQGDLKILEASLKRIEKATGELVHAIESRIGELEPALA